MAADAANKNNKNENVRSINATLQLQHHYSELVLLEIKKRSQHWQSSKDN